MLILWIRGFNVLGSIGVVAGAGLLLGLPGVNGAVTAGALSDRPCAIGTLLAACGFRSRAAFNCT